MKPKVFLRADGNYDADAASLETGLDASKEPSMTVQAQAADADINVIMRRAAVTGMLPQRAGVPMFGDFTDVHDFRSAQAVIAEVSGFFSNLPADLRAKFANDPARFAEFCSDEANHPELVKLGLLKAPEAAAEPVEPVPAPAPAAAPAPAKGA